MIAVRVGDENMGDGLAAHGVKQRPDMRIVVGAGIEDRDFAAADDVTHRALEGERAGIVGDQRAHARRDLFGLAGHEIEGLVERNVVAHAQSNTRFRAASQRSSSAARGSRTAETAQSDGEGSRK